MKRVLTFVLLVLLFLPLLSSIVGGEGKDVYTFLFSGYDDSADNTDAIIVFNYDINSNIATFLQLPRDTVCKYEGEITALNAIYPKEVAGGTPPYAAMEKLTEYVEKILGIEVDGFTGISLEAFRRFVDNLGGVEVYFEEDVYYKDELSGATLEFKKGENRLDGKAAEYFVRYRKGYLTGDVARVDMQKIFLSGLVKKVKNGLTFDVILNFLKDGGDGIVTNCKTRDILGLLTKNRGRIREAEVYFITLPGKSAENNNGKWVYSANKKASELLLAEQKFKQKDEFDKEFSLLIESEENLKKIYFDENLKWKKYTESDLVNIKVK